MPSMKTLRFPGSSAVYEAVDATARQNAANLQAQVNEMVDATLSETGKAADARATQEAIDAALSEAKGIIEEMGLSVVDGVVCITYRA